jgi:cold shock CspA family protein
MSLDATTGSGSVDGQDLETLIGAKPVLGCRGNGERNILYTGRRNMPEFPIEISFRNMDHSEFVESDIRKKIAGLERFYDRIHYCRVMVETLHRRHHKGNLYDVHIVLGVPGPDIVVQRTGPQNHAHEDAYVAIRDSFRAATRMLEDHVRKARGDVKTHDTPLHGKVAKIFSYEGYGFIETADGMEVYFHNNSVAEGKFDDLEPGVEVRLAIVEGEGIDGPQATTVRPIGKHHLVE